MFWEEGMNDTAWNDYWQRVAESYKDSKWPWAGHAVAAIKDHGDYADFIGFERWMTEVAGCGRGDLDPLLTAFAPVWDGMDVHARIALYGIVCQCLPRQ